MKQIQAKVKIIKNVLVGKDYALITLLAPEIAKAALPGQFVMVKVNCGLEPMLRRPLGIHKVAGKNVELLYEIIGKGTQILSRRKAGEYLDIIGPLGNGFEYHGLWTIDHRTILVAGGMGVAPLTFLAEKLIGKKPLVLIGAKSKDYINCEDEFKKLRCVVKVATDDGSKGFKGRVIDLLKKELLSIDHRPLTIYACGPKLMLEALSELTVKHNIPAQISLEAHMSCGFGACLGCVVNTREGYKRVCQDGPVFQAQEIVW